MIPIKPSVKLDFMFEIGNIIKSNNYILLSMTYPLRYQIDFDQLKCSYTGCDYSYSDQYQYECQDETRFRPFMIWNFGCGMMRPICQSCDAKLIESHDNPPTRIPVLSAHQCQFTANGNHCQRLAKVSYSADGRHNWIAYCSCHSNLSQLNQTHFIKGSDPTLWLDLNPSS
jgi:hypothetical protein